MSPNLILTIEVRFEHSYDRIMSYPPGEMHESLSSVLAQLRPLRASHMSGGSDDERLAVMKLLMDIESELAGLKTDLLAELEKDETTTRATGLATSSWVRHTSNVPQRVARSMVKDAKKTAKYQRFVEAVRAGSMTEFHRRIAVAAMETIEQDPHALAHPEILDICEEALVQMAREHDPDTFRARARELQERIAAETLQTQEEEAARKAQRNHEARFLKVSQSFDGSMTYVNAAFPTASALGALAVLNARAQAKFATTNPEEGPGEATIAQYRADAFLEVIAEDQIGSRSPVLGGDRPRIVITADFRQILAENCQLLGITDDELSEATVADDLFSAVFDSLAPTTQSDSQVGDNHAASAGDIFARSESEIRARARAMVDALRTTASRYWHRTTDTGIRLSALDLRLLACDAEIMFVDLDEQGVPRGSTSRSRTVGAKLRRELTVRDRGCVFPGCAVPATGCEAHHIEQWVRGGPTSLGNVVLVCAHHHRQVQHDVGDTEHWRIRMSEAGTPELIPPERVDPLQRPIIHDRYKAYREPSSGATAA